MTSDQEQPAPLSFKLIVGAAAVYLLIRLIQGIAWLVRWVF